MREQEIARLPIDMEKYRSRAWGDGPSALWVVIVKGKKRPAGECSWEEWFGCLPDLKLELFWEKGKEDELCCHG